MYPEVDFRSFTFNIIRTKTVHKEIFEVVGEQMVKPTITVLRYFLLIFCYFITLFL